MTAGRAAVVLSSPRDVHAMLEDEVQRWRPEILDLSHAIHADPELGGQEFRAVKRVQKVLRKAGFTFDETQPEEPTAFSARFGSGQLVVALCVEYDALPEIGHACGHNVNAASAVGAALALAATAELLDITVKVLGTPAEETTGGKVDLIEAGFFDDVSLAMMVHAGAADVVGGSSLAMSMWDVLFEGRPAHAAAAPSEGVNALDALVVAQMAIALARQQLPSGSIVSLIVTEGGSAVNVIPGRARASVEMRAPSIDQLRLIQGRVRRCLEAGALASGCTLQVAPKGNDYAELRQDQFLSQAYRAAMQAKGEGREVRLRPGGLHGHGQRIPGGAVNPPGGRLRRAGRRPPYRRVRRFRRVSRGGHGSIGRIVRDGRGRLCCGPGRGATETPAAKRVWVGLREVSVLAPLSARADNGVSTQVRAS